MNENSVSRAQLEALLEASDKTETVFWGKETVISYRLPNGFSVLGRSACVDPANFDPELGRKYAYEDALSQLWRLEGYRLQCHLHDKGVL